VTFSDKLQSTLQMNSFRAQSQAFHGMFNPGYMMDEQASLHMLHMLRASSHASRITLCPGHMMDKPEPLCKGLSRCI